MRDYHGVRGLQGVWSLKEIGGSSWTAWTTRLRMWNLSIGIKGPWKDFHQDRDSTRLRKSTLAAGWRMNENGESTHRVPGLR